VALRISAKELCERLRAADFLVSERTVQRDLNELSEVCAIAGIAMRMAAVYQD